MIPVLRTPEDIWGVIKYNRRWGRKQRILALQHAKKVLHYMRMRGDVSIQDGFAIQRALLPILAAEKRRWMEAGGEWPIRPSSAESPPGEKIEATEAAIEYAEEHGIDLSKVDGSGKDGRITYRDVTTQYVGA